MKDSKPLLDQVAQKIAHSSTISQTPAGPANASQPLSETHIRAINEVFALFRVNFHNQYYAAYKDSDIINTTKKLWASSLSRFDEQTLVNAAQRIVQQEEYLPTLNKMIRLCNELTHTGSIPSAHEAYVEACNASSPKQNAPWSHPAVYYAGKKTDWYFMANNTEKTVFPIYKSHYDAICQRVMNGEILEAIQTKALPESIEQPLTKEENSLRMKKLREEMGI